MWYTTMKITSFSYKTIIKIKIRDIKIKFIKVVIFKKKTFAHNLNVKIIRVQNFNLNFLLL